MNLYSLTALLYIAASIVLIGCSATNTTYEEKQKQDEYLKRNYPDKKSESREQPAISTSYYQEIMDGQVVVGMNLTEALLASKTYPHGANRFNTLFWCNERLISACDASCKQCSGILLTAKQMHLLEGKQDALSVVKSIPRHRDDTIATLQHKPFQVINALFLNEVVPGMTVTDFQRVAQLPDSRTEFYCKSQRVFQSCLFDCGECTIKIITPNNKQYYIQTIRFRGHNDHATIVDVSNSIASSTTP